MTTDKRLSSVLILRAKGEGRLCFLTLRCPHGNLKISFASHRWAIKTTQEMFACCNPRLKKNRHTYTRLWNVYFRGLLLLQNQLCYLARHDLSPRGLRDGLPQSGPMQGDSHLEEQGYQRGQAAAGMVFVSSGTGAVWDPSLSNAPVSLPHRE